MNDIASDSLVAQPLGGAGIGGFFDNVTHDAFGVPGNAFQSLYGFTVGANPRIRTEPTYGVNHDA